MMSPHDCIPEKPANYDVISSFKTRAGDEFFAFPKLGSFLAVTYQNGHNVLLSVAITNKGMPDGDADYGLSVIEVTNVDDDLNIIKIINSFFGTEFTLKDFPGR